MAPIRVRGKKKPYNQALGQCQPGIRALPSSKIYKQHISLSDSSIASGTPGMRSRKSSTRVLSLLERLPTELIQTIFFECLNISLPQASLKLASALSSFYVKSQLFFKVFSSDGFDLRCGEELLRLFPSIQEVSQLQSSILQLRWMNLDFLHQCIVVYLKKEFLNQYIASPTEGMDGILDHTTLLNFGTDIHRDCLGQHYQKQKVWFFGTTTFLIFITLPDGSMHLFRREKAPKQNSAKALNGRPFRCIQDVRIPEKLLRGEWTDDKCQFLDIVLRNGATIDWINSTNGEIVELGFQDALREQNVRAVEILTRKFTRSKRGYVQNVPKTLGYKFFGSGLGFLPTRQHLRLAATKYNCQIEILKIIMREGTNIVLHYMDPADRPLFVWAQQTSNKGDLRGHWLLEHFRYGNK